MVSKLAYKKIKAVTEAFKTSIAAADTKKPPSWEYIESSEHQKSLAKYVRK